MRITAKRFALGLLAGGLGLIAACVGGLFLWVAVATDDAAAEADSFLRLLVLDNTREAYLSTSIEFRGTQEQGRFEEEIRLLGLAEYELQTWRDRTVAREGNILLWGKMGNNRDAEQTFHVQLVEEGDDWKVRSFVDLRRSEVGPGAWFRQAPGEEELHRMTDFTIGRFIDAVENGSIREFWEQSSLGMRITIGETVFKNAYQYFIDDQIDISAVRDVEAVFDGFPVLGRAQISDTFAISGYYPMEPSPVAFKFTYIYRHPNWGLYRILVKEPDQDTLSPDQCLKWLSDNPGRTIAECFAGKE